MDRVIESIKRLKTDKTPKDMVEEIDKAIEALEWEKEKERLNQIPDKLQAELEEHFKDNTFNGWEIKKFSVTKSSWGHHFDINPIEPYIDECADIDKKFNKFCDELGEKHGVHVGWVSCVYAK